MGPPTRSKTDGRIAVAVISTMVPNSGLPPSGDPELLLVHVWFEALGVGGPDAVLAFDGN